MDRTERFYRIDHLLNERRSVPIEVFLHELEVSRATFKRDLEYLRDRLNAPIVLWDRASRGYRGVLQVPGWIGLSTNPERGVAAQLPADGRGAAVRGGRGTAQSRLNATRGWQRMRCAGVVIDRGS